MPRPRKGEKPEPTEQISLRLRVALLDALEDIRESFPEKPSLTYLIATAVAEYVDRKTAPPAPPEEAPAKPRPRKR